MRQEIIEYVTKKHNGQTRKNGEPYINHPLAVAKYLKDNGFDERYELAGLFHDLLEDTDATEDEILKFGGQEVLEAVKLLTKNSQKSSKQYIEDICKNPIAKMVKDADRINNLLDSRYANPIFFYNYLQNTKEHYVGKFSLELDLVYDMLVNESSKYEYLIDTSFGDESPIYRTSPSGSFIYDYQKGFVEIDAFFWADLGDNALTITKEKVFEIIQSHNKEA